MDIKLTLSCKANCCSRANPQQAANVARRDMRQFRNPTHKREHHCPIFVRLHDVCESGWRPPVVTLEAFFTNSFSDILTRCVPPCNKSFLYETGGTDDRVSCVFGIFENSHICVDAGVLSVRTGLFSNTFTTSWITLLLCKSQVAWSLDSL